MARAFVNVKTLGIQRAFDAVLTALEADASLIPQGFTALEGAISMIETALRAEGHAMIGNAGAICTQRAQAVARGAKTRATVSELSTEERALAEAATGRALADAPAQATPQAATEPLDTPENAQDFGPIDALVAHLHGSPLPFSTVLAVQRRAETAAYEAARAASSSDPVFGFQPSGLATLPMEHAMVGAIDTLLATALPGTTWAGTIAAIGQAEQAVAARRAALIAAERQAAQAAALAKAIVVPTPAQEQPMHTPYATARTPELRVVERKARDVFAQVQVYGAAATLLEFDVPTYAFDTPVEDVPQVDPTYKFFAPVLVEALQTIVNNEILWLYGDSGCGKSEFWKQVAAYLGMPFTRLNMDGHLTRGDIIGVNRMVPNADRQMEMRFVDGLLPRAMARPGLLLIDELDLGDPEIMAVLQPVLEGEPLRILEDHGRVVQPHPFFRIGVTGNTTGLGVGTHAYVNAFEQSAATRDRIAAYIKMPYLPPSMEEEVLLARTPGVDKKFVKKLVQLANLVREGYEKGTIQQIFSMRSTQAAMRRYALMATKYPSEQEAVLAILETVVLNRMDHDSRQAAKALVDKVFG